MKLKDLREEAGMTQKQLAEKIGNSQRNISNWESGNSQPDLETVVRLADLFGVTTDELLGRTGYCDTGYRDTGYRGADQNAIRYGEETAKLMQLAEKLTRRQKQALIAFLESLTNQGD